MTGAAHRDSIELDTEEFEWARIRKYLGASEAPLALIELASPDQAVSVIERIGDGARRVEVCRIDPADDFRQPLDWLEAREHPGVFLFVGFDAHSSDPDREREFWTWANGQRERWQRDGQKVVFLLLPRGVDALCRYAPMLWDWIPLKFNLTGGELRTLDRGMFVRPARQAESSSGQEEPGDAGANDVLQAARLRARLDRMRQQLLRARQRELPEHVVRRDYAWPFFNALVNTGEYEEAQRILTDELGLEFPSELPYTLASTAWPKLKAFLKDKLASERMNHSERAMEFYFKHAFLPFGKDACLMFYWCLRAIFALAANDCSAAERYCQRFATSATNLALNDMQALAYEWLGIAYANRGRYNDAVRVLQKAVRQNAVLGDSASIATVVRRLGAVAHLSRLEKREPHFSPARRMAVQREFIGSKLSWSQQMVLIMASVTHRVLSFQR